MTRLTHEQLNPPIDVRDATEGDGIVFRDGVFTAEPVRQPNIGFSGARVRKTANTSATTSTWTAFDFGSTPTIEFDTDSYFDTASSTRLTAPASGHYMIVGTIHWASSSTGERRVRIEKNGTTVYEGGPAETHAAVSSQQDHHQSSVIIQMDATDYVEIKGWQDTGGDLNLLAGSLSITRLGTTGGQSNLLGEVVLTADAANIEIANIPGTYKDLRVECSLKSDRSGVTSHDSCRLQVGNGTVDTGSNYRWAANRSDLNLTTTVDNNSSTSDTDITQGTAYGMAASNGSNSHADAYASSTIILTDYASGDYKQVRWDGGSPVPANATSWLVRNRGVWNSTSAIDIIRLTPEVGTNWKAGSVVRVYGEPVLGGGSGLVKGDYLPGDLYLGGQIFENEAATGRTELYAIGGADSPVPEWISYLTTRQSGETPHIDDDFFGSDSSGDYTTTNASGSSTWTISRGLLSVKFDSQLSQDLSTFLKSITSASSPMTIETQIEEPAWLDSEAGTAGICFTDGTATTANVAGLQIQVPGTQDRRIEARHGTINAMSGTGWYKDVMAWPRYLRIIWTAANTWAGAVSTDGVSWTDYASSTFSKTLTPTHFGFYVSRWGTGAEPETVGFNYLRVYDSDLSV